MASAFLCDMGMERLQWQERDTASFHLFKVLGWLPGTFSALHNFVILDSCNRFELLYFLFL